MAVPMPSIFARILPSAKVTCETGYVCDHGRRCRKKMLELNMCGHAPELITILMIDGQGLSDCLQVIALHTIEYKSDWVLVVLRELLNF